MRRTNVAFEWQELHENQELPPIVETRKSPPVANPWQQGSRLIASSGALCLLATALFSSAWAMGQAQSERAQLHDELAMAVELEIRQTGDEHPSLAASTGGSVLTDRAAPAGYQATLPLYEVARRANPRFTGAASSGFLLPSQDEMLAVEVQALGQGVVAVMVVTEAKIDEGGPATAYRQLRFYRQTEGGWQPTAPIPSLWGQPQALATEYFDITYRSRDADAVTAVAGELDALYAEMRRNFGLSPTTKQKIVVEVIVGPVPSQWAAPDKVATHVFVASPALLPAPDFLTDTAILRQLILVDLVAKVSLEAIHTHKMPGRWHPLLTPMRLWQTWEAGGPLAAWHQPLFRWLYGELPHADNDDFTRRLPSFYPQLCAHHRVWLGAQLRVGIPWFCNPLDLAAVDALDRTSLRAPVRLAEFTRLPFYGRHDDYAVHSEQAYIQGRLESIALVGLLDYAVAAYGRESMRALWPAFREHKNWETLIPAVFGVTMDEFEAGWQAYLGRFREEALHSPHSPGF